MIPAGGGSLTDVREAADVELAGLASVVRDVSRGAGVDLALGEVLLEYAPQTP